MKKLLLVLALTVTTVAAFAQADFARSPALGAPQAVTLTNAQTSTATWTPFRLTCLPGGSTSTLTLQASLVSTNGGTTVTNTTVYQFATTIGDSASGPWVTNLGFSFAFTGTNPVSQITGTNLSPPPLFVKLVTFRTAGTNTSVNTLLLGQFR